MTATRPDFTSQIAAFTADMTARAAAIHSANVEAGWWSDKSGNRIERNMGELLMLCVTEVSEAHVGALDDLMDDHLPHRKMLEVELADVEIRLLDICGSRGFDVGDLAQVIYDTHYDFSAQLFWVATLKDNSFAMMKLVNTLSGAMEGARKPDQKKHGVNALHFELANALLLVRTIGYAFHLDVAAAVDEKLAYNRQRADHKPENRFAPGGKVC